jgi:parallel beta-helix repeat protein
MNRNSVFIILAILVVSTFALSASVQVIMAGGTIYINADGSISSATASITTVDNVTYTFVGNINGSIVVQRNNIIIDGNGDTLQGSGGGTGFDLSGVSNVTIKNVTITSFTRAVSLNHSYENALSDNDVTANTKYGIFLDSSDNNTLSGNNVTNNEAGIFLDYSSNNVVSGNKAVNNGFGIGLQSSPYNTLSDNAMVNNTYSFGVSDVPPLLLSSYLNYVDTSNTVDGRPVYYWINKHDMTVPSNVGYVALVNCTRMAVQNLDLASNAFGVVLAYTTNATVTENNVANNDVGIWLSHSSDNIVSENNVTAANSFGGILLDYSSRNTISANNVTAKSHYGVGLSYYSDYNTISGNDVTNNYYGIVTQPSSSNNMIYDNNFIDNTQQALSDTLSVNTWDDGYPSSGNYWSDYAGVDLYSGAYQNATEPDGVGDTPYVISYANNADRYPLMHPFDPQTENMRVGIRNLLLGYNSLQSNFGSLNSTYDSLLTSYASLQSNYNNLRTNQAALNSSYTSLKTDYDALNASYNSLNASSRDYQQTTQNELTNVNNALYVFIAVTAILAVALAYMATRKPKTKPET